MAITINTKELVSNLSGFASFFHLNPYYFNYLDPSCKVQVNDICLDFWGQFAYTSPNGLSIELLASLLKEAEYEIKKHYNLTVGEWVEDEKIMYPTTVRHGERLAPTFHDVKLVTKYPIKVFGQKEVNILATSSIVYHDYDNDGYNEVARLTYNIPVDVSSDDLKFYYPDHAGESGYELNNYRVISNINNVIIVEFDAYDLVKLEVINKHRFTTGKSNDMCGDIYLSMVSIVEEKVSECLPSVKLWYRDTCVENCEYLHTPACGIKLGNRLFRINLQAYDENGCVVGAYNNLHCMPLNVEYLSVNYYSETEYKDIVQSAIYYIAAARFPLQSCECPCIKSIFGGLQQDIRYRPKDSGTWSVSSSDYLSPFGTKIGELKAYYLLDSLNN